MKTRLVLFTLASEIASSLLFAADNNAASSAVDLPVTRIEVTVALKQYEKVQSLLLDAELDRKLQNADPNIPKDKSAGLDARIEILHSELKKLRTLAEAALKAARDDFEREARIVARVRSETNIIDLDSENLVVPPMLEPKAKGDPLAYIAAKEDMEKYLKAKTRYLKAKNHWQKLDALCQ